MAVIVLKREAFKFHWNEIEFGLRLPTVEEMEILVKKRDAFFASVGDDESKGQSRTGDTALWNHYIFAVGEMLACDPDDTTVAWFAKDATEGQKKDFASAYPAPFFALCSEKFDEMVKRAQMDDDNRVLYDKQTKKIREAAIAAMEGDEDVTELPDPTAAAATPSDGTDSIPTQQNSGDSVSASNDISNTPSVTTDTTVSST